MKKKTGKYDKKGKPIYEELGIGQACKPMSKDMKTVNSFNKLLKK